MGYYTEEELEALLQTKTPDEIDRDEQERLDDVGRAFLAGRREAPDVDDILRDSGRLSRELWDNPPDFKLPDDFQWERQPGRLHRMVFGRRIPNYLAAALLICGFLAMQMRETVVLDKTVEFPRLLDHPGAEAVDDALFQALKARGLHFLAEAERTDSEALYKEAFQDLDLAARLRDDEEVDTALIEVLRIINEKYEDGD